MTETKLHLGCGDNIKPDARNVDAVGLEGVDEVVDLNEYPWPWEDNRWRYILAEHVFEHLDSVEQALRECARVLEPGGRLEVVWPMGMNERADPDHKHTWVWDTPLYYCGERHWDIDVGLEVIERDAYIGTHFNGVAKVVYGGLIKLYDYYYGPDRWMFDMPVTSGEFRVVFQKR